MIIRALIVLVATAGLLFAACGPPPVTEKQICGDLGCDSCIGAVCGPTDAGVR